MEQETSDWILFFGRFHPLVLHLPIGFLLIAFLLETLSRFRPFTLYKPAVLLILGLGAAFSIITTILGLMLARAGDYSPELLSIHQWYGIALTVTACTAFALKKISVRKSVWEKVYLSVMLCMVGCLVIAGHYGGSLTHGSDYLTQYMPGALRRIAGLPVSESRRVPITNLSDAQVFSDIIHPILNTRCVSCHNESKRKGDLMMHTPKALLAGGENGPIFIPGNAAGSNMIERIHLPEIHDDHMPPKGKTQLTTDEITLLTWWINEGAPFDKKVAEVRTDDEVQSVLNALVDPDANKTAVEKLLATPVKPADEQMVKALQGKGIVLRPLSSEVHWLQASLNERHQLSVDTMAEAFSSVSEQLTWLNLGGTKTTDEILASIGELKNLTILHLENTEVTDNGLKHLTSLPYLEYLNLYGTKVSDTGIQQLRELKNLKKLYVWQTSVTVEGVAKLKVALPELEVDRGLDNTPNGSLKKSVQLPKEESKSVDKKKNLKIVKN